MNANSKYLLVTWDFTAVSDYALAHAIKIAKPLNKHIRLIHIVDSKKLEADEEKTGQLQAIVDKNIKNEGIEGYFVIKHGTIFDTISNYAAEIEANLVLMGTHGVNGMQKLFGSKALKVVMGSKVPFIVVQNQPNHSTKFSNIVFPIDFRWENREKLSWAIYLGNYYETKIHIYRPPEKDTGLAKKVNMNIGFAVKFLMQNNIKYEIYTAEKKSTFEEETINFAASINADLIIIMTTKNASIADFMLGLSEQKLIANNAGIPIMCVNPRSHFVDMGQFMFSGR
ncbi:MAG: universal stress protein [Bacteroidales bacterium]|nr:universal stress protein [Bacteroidales bacterium]